MNSRKVHEWEAAIITEGGGVSEEEKQVLCQTLLKRQTEISINMKRNTTTL